MLKKFVNYPLKSFNNNLKIKGRKNKKNIIFFKILTGSKSGFTLKYPP